MENISLAIVSHDRAYSEALCRSLLTVCRDFIIRSFETRQFMKEWSDYKGEGSYNKVYDLILWDGPEIENNYSENMVYLGPRASYVKMDTAGRKFCIYKYSSAQSMAASIFDIYGYLTGRSPVYVRKDKVDLLGFASWEGGAGCSTVALAVAQELKRFAGKRVLYLTLEAVESTGSFFGKVPDVRSVGEYLYRVLSRRNMPFMDAYIIRDMYGVEAFAPSGGRNPLPELSGDDMQRFLASLIDSGFYDTIVIDLSNCVSEAGTSAMQMADSLAFVSSRQDRSQREDTYLGHVIRCAGESVEAKAVRVTNRLPERDRDTEGQSSGPEAENYILQNHRKVRSFPITDDSSEPYQIMLEGAFGEDIAGLTTYMTSTAP